MRGEMTKRECRECKAEFSARVADVNRGWAQFCSKSCKATNQENIRQTVRELEGKPRKPSWWEITP